jgi:uncharacterized membrane protein YfcA
VQPVVATAYSLFIVGLTSAVGTVGYFKRVLVNIKTAIVLVFHSYFCFTTRALIVPAIPKRNFTMGLYAD